MSSLATDNAPARYELNVDGNIAFANYRNIDGVITIKHTETPRALRGQGIGSRLVVDMLKQIRAQNLKVRPLCSFAAAAVAEHSEFQDLLA